VLSSELSVQKPVKQIINDGNRRTLAFFAVPPCVRLHGVPDVVQLPGLRQRIPEGQSAADHRGNRHAFPHPASAGCAAACHDLASALEKKVAK
jgi:hypothetical protein